MTPGCQTVIPWRLNLNQHCLVWGPGNGNEKALLGTLTVSRPGLFSQYKRQLKRNNLQIYKGCHTEERMDLPSIILEDRTRTSG